MAKQPKSAIEAIRLAAEKAALTLHIVEPKPGSGTVTFLAKKPTRDEGFDEFAPERDDDGTGVGD